MRTAFLTAIAVLAAAAPAAAQELDAQVSTLTRATPVSAFGTTAAWSEVDPATGRYRLAVLRGREWKLVDVPSRSVPFDVDVGPGPEGVTVSYSRCTLEPPERFGPTGLSVLPDYTRGRDCRMFRYDVRDGRERPLAGSRRGVLPSVWGSRVAFLVPGTRALRTADASGGSRLRRRAGGPAGTRLTSLDLAARGRLAAVWHGSRRTQLRLGARVVARVGRPATVLGMGFDSGVLFFRTTCSGSPDGCPESYWAYRPRSRSRFAAPESADLVAAAHGGGNTYALLGFDGGSGIGCAIDAPCKLIIEDQLEFSRVPR
jgi:hypothetical protein